MKIYILIEEYREIAHYKVATSLEGLLKVAKDYLENELGYKNVTVKVADNDEIHCTYHYDWEDDDSELNDDNIYYRELEVIDA